MILISCVDNGLGLRFNRRRQSRDRALCSRILELSGGKLWLREESRGLFDAFPDAELTVVNCPEEVPEGACCFWEEPVKDTLEPEAILLYHWNRDYPAEEFFRFPGGKKRWTATQSLDFPGFSHPQITEERFEKKE